MDNTVNQPEVYVSFEVQGGVIIIDSDNLKLMSFTAAANYSPKPLEMYRYEDYNLKKQGKQYVPNMNQLGDQTGIFNQGVSLQNNTNQTGCGLFNHQQKGGLTSNNNVDNQGGIFNTPIQKGDLF
jgi:hypothetical protein